MNRLTECEKPSLPQVPRLECVSDLRVRSSGASEKVWQYGTIGCGERSSERPIAYLLDVRHLMFYPAVERQNSAGRHSDEQGECEHTACSLVLSPVIVE